MAAKNWNTIVIKAPDGYTYAVPRIAVEDDWAQVHMELDDLSLGYATEKARGWDDRDIECWFVEQCHDLGWVKHNGIVVRRPTYAQLLKSERCNDIEDCTIKYVKL